MQRSLSAKGTFGVRNMFSTTGRYIGIFLAINVQAEILNHKISFNYLNSSFVVVVLF